MAVIIPVPQRRFVPEGPSEPFEFIFKMTGDRSDNIALEATFSREPETIPRLTELLRTLAARIELGNF